MSSPAVTHPLIDRLREVIAERHLTQREVAADLDVALRTIAYWLNDGATPQPAHRRAIVAWLARIEETA